MATLKVKNVGPIRDAELEVKKHTIFIGPQGSGKSTLAKLIAIGADEEIVYGAKINQDIFKKYVLMSYLDGKSYFSFEGNAYTILYENSEVTIRYTEYSNNPTFGKETFEAF